MVMNSLQVNYFLKLAETLSFTKTAQQYYVSQPAISKQINALEKELGFKLFERNNKSTALTAEGKLFYDFFSKAAADFNQTLHKAQKILDSKTETISVGFMEAWDLSTIISRIKSSKTVIEKNLKLNFISCRIPELNQKLTSGEIDIAITISKLHNLNPKMKSSYIASISRLLFYSANHHLASKFDLKFKDFRDEHFVVFSSKFVDMEKLTYEACKQFGIVPRIQTVPNIESMVLSVESGESVAIFDDWIRYKYNPMLNYIDIGLTHEISAVRLSSKTNPILEQFIEELKSCINQ
jgi:DNA-binding transcriptional LysR family regulator